MKSIETISPEDLVTATGGDASAASTSCVETPAERAERMRSPFDKIGSTVGGSPAGLPSKWGGRPGSGPTIFNPSPSDIFGGSRFPR